MSLIPTDHCDCTSGSVPSVESAAKAFAQQFTTQLTFGEFYPRAPMCKLDDLPELTLRGFMNGLNDIFEDIVGGCVNM